MYNGVLYSAYTSEGDLVLLTNLGRGHRCYGKVDLSEVNITWYLALAVFMSRWELNSNR